MSPIFCQNPCFVQPFYGMWPKLKTLSQRGEKWNSIGVQYLAETYTLYNHLRYVAQTLDFFAEWRKLDWNRSMPMSPIFCQNPCFVQPFYGMWPKLQTLSRERRNMDFHWSMGMSPIFSKRILCATILRHVAQTSEFFAELGAKTRLKSIYANESNI